MGGVLGESIGIVATIVLGSVISILALFWVLFSPVMALTSIPEQAGGS
jgi:hypothetical protein